MRRKSERNKVRSPEKKVEKPSRRTRRRRGSPDSGEEPQSENEAPQTSQEEVKSHPEAITKNPSTDSKESNSNSEEEIKEQSVWQVKSAETPSDTGEIQKLKICLQRPSSSERSPRKHHGSSQESADSSEEIRKKRSKKHYHSQEDTSEVKTKKEDTESNQVENTQIQQEEKSETAKVKEEEHAEEPISDKKVSKIDISAMQTEKILNKDDVQPSPDIANDSTNKPEIVNDNSSQVSCESKQKTNVSKEVVNDNESVKHEDEKRVEIKKENVAKEQPEVVEKKEIVCKVETVEVVEKAEENREATQIVEPLKTPTEVTPEITQPEVKEISTTVEKMETEDKEEKSVETARPRRNSHIEAQTTEKSDTSDKSCRTLEHSNSTESASANADTEKVTRKRRWGSKRRVSTDKKPVLAISTDSLKNLISDVKPLSVNDVQLEVRNDKSSSEYNKNEEKSEVIEEKDNTIDTDKLDQSEKDYEADEPQSDEVSDHNAEVEKKRARSVKTDTDKNDSRSDHSRSRRKISVNENVPLKQSSSQPKSKPSEVLYITNLVRPFTVLQLKGLLARTGKLTENGFWIDNIKSKCFVRYENEDQAVETRHALHGTRWPASNPKLLQVEFSTVEEMDKCVSSVPPSAPADNTIRRTIDSDKVAMAWLAEQNFKDERTRGRDALRDKKQSVREWDMGKQDPSVQEAPEKYARDVPVEYPREAINRDRREERFDGRDKRRSRSRSPVRRFKRKDEEAPAKRLDDLFRKTKVTPCIYWLPLTPEQISVKEEMRRQHMAEHERRKEVIRKQERERDRERHLQREKQNSTNRDREHRRNSSHHNSRSGDRNNH